MRRMAIGVLTVGLMLSVSTSAAAQERVLSRGNDRGRHRRGWVHSDH